MSKLRTQQTTVDSDNHAFTGTTNSFSGTITVPDQLLTDNSQNAANTTFVHDIIDTLVLANNFVPVLAATTTNTTLSGVRTVDGVVTTDNERIYVGYQTSGINNGIYITNSTGFWTRSTDMYTGKDVAGFYFLCKKGATNANNIFFNNSSAPVIVGTNSIAFNKLYSPYSNVIFVNGLGNNSNSGLRIDQPVADYATALAKAVALSPSLTNKILVFNPSGETIAENLTIPSNIEIITYGRIVGTVSIADNCYLKAKEITGLITRAVATASQKTVIDVETMTGFTSTSATANDTIIRTQNNNGAITLSGTNGRLYFESIYSHSGNITLGNLSILRMPTVANFSSSACYSGATGYLEIGNNGTHFTSVPTLSGSGIVHFVMSQFVGLTTTAFTGQLIMKAARLPSGSCHLGSYGITYSPQPGYDVEIGDLAGGTLTIAGSILGNVKIGNMFGGSSLQFASDALPQVSVIVNNRLGGSWNTPGVGCPSTLIFLQNSTIHRTEARSYNSTYLSRVSYDYARLPARRTTTFTALPEEHRGFIELDSDRIGEMVSIDGNQDYWDGWEVTIFNTQGNRIDFNFVNGAIKKPDDPYDCTGLYAEIKIYCIDWTNKTFHVRILHRQL
jgi:hypothetical protein